MVMWSNNKPNPARACSSRMKAKARHLAKQNDFRVVRLHQKPNKLQHNQSLVTVLAKRLRNLSQWLSSQRQLVSWSWRTSPRLNLIGLLKNPWLSRFHCTASANSLKHKTWLAVMTATTGSILSVLRNLELKFLRLQTSQTSLFRAGNVLRGRSWKRRGSQKKRS